MRFEVDGLTTATTRTLTIPDKDGTLAMTSDLVDESIAAAATATNYTPTASNVEGHLAGIDTALGSV